MLFYWTAVSFIWADLNVKSETRLLQGQQRDPMKLKGNYEKRENSY